MQRRVDATALDAAAIDAAARALAAGELVVFPTETVYGLGADAAQADAVAAVYRLKGRPAGHPLIVHVADAAQAAWWADWPPAAQRLADAFWPGPLTLILPRRPQAPAFACGDESTVGLRCPSHPVAHALLGAFAALGGHGVAAPSANRFGRVSPTTAGHVVDDLGDEAPMILDGGPCEVGVESTIIDLSRGHPVLLRPGGVTAGRIAAVLGEPVRAPDAQAPRASGTLAAHYAPVTPIELVEGVALAQRIARACKAGERVAVWARPGSWQADGSPADLLWEPMPDDPSKTSRTLYATVRRLDRSGCSRILVQAPPADERWAAVADRLRRAAAGSALTADTETDDA
ncbi:MAG: L-threonylcarbamoyladenylate synthase [Burkholderiaceae bacterium]